MLVVLDFVFCLLCCCWRKNSRKNNSLNSPFTIFGGGQLPKALISPPGNSTGPDGHQARKIGAAWADSGCGSPLLFDFPFSGRFSGSPPPFPLSSVPGLAFRGSGGPPLLFGWGLHLGIRPPARVDHDDVEAPPPFPVWDDLHRGANRAPVDFA